MISLHFAVLCKFEINYTQITSAKFISFQRTWCESVEVHVVMDGGIPGGHGTHILLITLDNGQLEELVAVLFGDYCIVSRHGNIVSVSLGRKVIRCKYKREKYQAFISNKQFQKNINN